MPRKHLIRTSEFPYHITNRSNNREFFYLDLERLWPIFIENLACLQEQFKIEIHCFVLMSNHYHLILSTPLGNLGEAMKYLHREVAREANRISGRINHFFGGRYKWSVIGREDYYWNATKYIFRNPVRAGITGSVFDYSFSSLNRDANKFNMCDWFRADRPSIELDAGWLEEPFLKEQEEGLKKALRRREFKLPADKSGRELHLAGMRRKKGTVT
jgi:putative transposase